MKKIIILLLLALPVISLAQEETTWDFPVKPGSKEWKTLNSPEKMYNAMQIPEGILQKISTEKLAELCVDYPLFSTVLAHNSIQAGFNYMKNKFNGMLELLDRPDVASVMIKLFKTTDSNWILEEPNPGNSFGFRVSFLTMLLAQDEIVNRLSESERKQLYEETVKKYNIIAKNEKFGFFYFRCLIWPAAKCLNEEGKIDTQLEKYLDTFLSSGEIIDKELFTKLYTQIEKNAE
jgi:hypothetical protein